MRGSRGDTVEMKQTSLVIEFCHSDWYWCLCLRNSVQSLQLMVNEAMNWLNTEPVTHGQRVFALQRGHCFTLASRKLLLPFFVIRKKLCHLRLPVK